MVCLVLRLRLLYCIAGLILILLSSRSCTYFLLFGTEKETRHVLYYNYKSVSVVSIVIYQKRRGEKIKDCIKTKTNPKNTKTKT